MKLTPHDGLSDPTMTVQTFQVNVCGRVVPGALFLPVPVVCPVPLVLYQHGGGQHKLSEAALDMAKALVSRRGCAMVCIDGPVHGARRTDWPNGQDREATSADFRLLWRSGGGHIDSFLDDWRAVIDEVLRLPEIDAQAIGWVGLSMGTAYGVPLLAAEPRICAAVLGLWGTDYAASERVASDASRLTCAVLFQQKWDDELMSRSGQADLFDRIGSADKRLRAYPGGHGNPTGEQLDDIERFMHKRLERAQQAYRRATGKVPLPTPAQARSRLGRFADLTPTVKRQQHENAIPPGVYEQLSAHRTYVFMAPRGLGGPISGGAGVVGGDNGDSFRVGIAICPPGNGPASHAHMNTYETFINTRGRWQISWGENDEHTLTLELYDVFACPPGVFRKFKNITDEEAHLMVIIQGDRDVFDDVYLTSASRNRIVAEYGEKMIDLIRPAGLRFVDDLRAKASPPVEVA